MQSLVSIIIPCHDAESWVAEAIQSCVDQTYQPVEIIVVDDGSTDRSLQVIKSFGNKVRFETGPKRGGAAARNIGLQLAKGDYIQFLDSDDILTPQCVASKIHSALQLNTIVCSQVGPVKDAPMKLATSFWNKTEYSLEYMLRNGTPATPAPLHHRKQLLSIGGFREDLPCAHEYDLHLRLGVLLNVKFVTIDHLGVLIRPRKDSLSRKSGHKMPLTIVDVLLKTQELLQINGKATTENKSAIAQHLTHCARALWRAGQVNEARLTVNHAKALSKTWFAGCYNGTIVGSWIIPLLGFSGCELLSLIYNKSRRFGVQDAPHE